MRNNKGRESTAIARRRKRPEMVEYDTLHSIFIFFVLELFGFRKRKDMLQIGMGWSVRGLASKLAFTTWA